MKTILKLSVTDSQGVMDRVAGVIRRFGCNISTIAAGDITDGVSDICIAFHSHGADVEAMGNRLAALDCVQKWEICNDQTDMVRELVLVKIHKDQMSKMDIPHIRILETKGEDTYFEYSGTSEEVDQFLGKLRELKFTFTRTGPVCMSKANA